MTLLKELITIPEQVNRGDFVLNLSEGVTRPDKTMETYVVTPQLAESFKDALSFIKSAIEEKKSKASYLHGSFGSGKSHFMAVISLLLANHPATHTKPALLDLIGVNPWVVGKKFLLVPFHMIGKPNMESAILGGYAEHVHKLHPDKPYPSVFLAEKIIDNANHLRQNMGDPAFFKMLNHGSAPANSSGKAESGGWGALSGSWDAASYKAASEAAPQHRDKLRLVADIADRVLPSVKSSGQFVSLDDGLSIISRHAKELGYDAIILFLDELILWLLTRAADLSFVQSEGQKLAKLVESQSADRPVPIISFVARQRDLREAIGTHVPGAEKLNFADTLRHWEGRFHVINLEDRNLPLIARERLLKPKSELAKATIDGEFAKTQQIRKEVMDVLLTREGKREEFRDLYPFSPALVQVLVAISGALQRERTALKILLHLLVDQRDTMQLGTVVPVGDLWDMLADGEEVFSPNMKLLMENAKKLYRDKLRPMLLEEVHLPGDWDGSMIPGQEPAMISFRNHDRLIKTLLLAALAPEVESLRSLDARKLAALNHGCITSPVPGKEKNLVHERLKAWASQVGEIRLSGDLANQTVALQLTGVDTEAVLSQARSEDNAGNRKRLVQTLLFEALGISITDQLLPTEHTVVWRGSAHSVEVLYINVREANEEHLKSPTDRWKVIIDFPFDPGYTTAHDIGQLQRFRDRHKKPERTIVWLPSFFTEAALKDLGDLVVINFVLSGDRFTGYAHQLSAQDQQAAKAILENRRASLKQRMINAMEAAYGLHNAAPGMIEEEGLSFADHFHSLFSGFKPQPPATANLKDGLTGLIHQALENQYPQHPRFEIEVKLGSLRRVYDYVSRAVASKDGRITDVDRAHRNEMAGIAQPLRLGTSNDNVFAISRDWVDHFHKQKAADSVDVMTVRNLMDWMDRPDRCGLEPKVRFLVIKLFAEQTNRAFYRHNVLDQPSFEQIDPSMDLRDQRLPEDADWTEARRRSELIFGFVASPLKNASTVNQFVADIQKRASEGTAGVADLVQELQRVYLLAGVQLNAVPRAKAAKCALGLLTVLKSCERDCVIETLARVPLDVEPAVIGNALGSAVRVTMVLKMFDWGQLAQIQELPDPFTHEAAELLTQTRAVLAGSELERPLDTTLKSLSEQMRGLVSKALRAIAPPKPLEPLPVSPMPGLSFDGGKGMRRFSNGVAAIRSERELTEAVGELKEIVQANPDQTVELSYKIVKGER